MPDADGERELVLDAERRLQEAQRAGDVQALDALLDDRLVATGPDGASFGKADDLEAHRSGVLRITKLVQEDLDVLLDGDVAITRVTVSAEAVQGGVPTAGRSAVHPHLGPPRRRLARAGRAPQRAALRVVP